MTALLTAAFNAITQGLLLVNNKAATEYQHKFTEAALELQREERKGDDADDGKIEALYSELTVLSNAAESEFKLALAARNSNP